MGIFNATDKIEAFKLKIFLWKSHVEKKVISFKAVVHNVRPAPSPDVARDVQQEKRLFKESIAY